MQAVAAGTTNLGLRDWVDALPVRTCMLDCTMEFQLYLPANTPATATAIGEQALENAAKIAAGHPDSGSAFSPAEMAISHLIRYHRFVLILESAKVVSATVVG